MAEKLGSGLQIRVGVCDSRYHLQFTSDRFAISARRAVNWTAVRKL